MRTVTASEARATLDRLIDEAATSHQPVLITGGLTNAVLLSEEDWSAIQETFFLMPVPAMRESIVEGLNTPSDACSHRLDW